MTETVWYEVRDGSAVIWLDNPPVNALAHGLRQRIAEGLERAQADDTVQDIVLIGRGRGFSAGADISEFDAPPRDPWLPELCNRIESSPKPVIAALHGLALGGGFEVALAAHVRLALPDTQVGLPEVKLGLLPGAGGTQRAPRLLGVRVALDLMLSGVPRRADHPDMAPAFDYVVEGDLLGAALAVCAEIRAAGGAPRRTCNQREALRDFAAVQAEIARRRAQVEALPEQAPREIVSCVESAALLPFAAGLDFERAAFDGLLGGEQSRALRHAFMAERRAARAARPQGDVRPPSRVAVLGSGPLSAQIAISLLNAGLEVRWGMQDIAAQQDGPTRLRQHYDQVIAAGRFDAAGRDARLARLFCGAPAAALQGADLVLLGARGQEPLIAGATVPCLTAVPGKVPSVGLRFAPPVPASRLVEVIEGPEADDAGLDAAFALVARMGRLPVHVVSAGMTVTERLAAALHRAADALVDTGLSPYEVDAALLAWGWTRPPYQLRDMFGLDGTVNLVRAEGARNWSRDVVALGRHGRGQGGGFYDYPPGEPPRPNREVLEAINAQRAPQRVMSKSAAAQLIVAALANEGARMLADGWVTYPSDIDIACLYAFDFPRWRGGPLQAADSIGLFNCMRYMKALEHPDTPFWTPHTLIRDLVKNGRNFGSMNSD